MLRALATTLARESLTSLGEPVEPEVLSRTARSGWRSCAVPGRTLLEPSAGGLDDVGPVVVEQVRVPLDVAWCGQQHRVPAGQRGEVGDDGLDVVAGLQQDQSARRARARPRARRPARPARRTTSTVVRSETRAVASGRPPRSGWAAARRPTGWAVTSGLRVREGQHVAGDPEADGRAGGRDAPRRDSCDHDRVAVAHAHAQGGVVAEVAHVDDVGHHALACHTHRAGGHAHLLGADDQQDRPGHRTDERNRSEIAGGPARCPACVGGPGQERGVADEPGHLRGGRPEVDVGRGRHLEEPARRHHGHLVGQRQRLALVVGDQHGRRSARAQRPGHGATGVLAQTGVERGERLVEEHERRIRREGPSQRDALLLTARQLVGEARRDRGRAARRGRGPRVPGPPRAHRAAGRNRRWRSRRDAGRAHPPGGRSPRDADGRAPAGPRPRPRARRSRWCRASGSRKPATSRSSVVLPQPEGPSTAVMPSVTLEVQRDQDRGRPERLGQPLHAQAAHRVPARTARA